MVEWLSGLKQKSTKFQCVKAPKVRILVQPINGSSYNGLLCLALNEKKGFRSPHSQPFYSVRII